MYWFSVASCGSHTASCWEFSNATETVPSGPITGTENWSSSHSFGPPLVWKVQ